MQPCPLESMKSQKKKKAFYMLKLLRLKQLHVVFLVRCWCCVVHNIIVYDRPPYHVYRCGIEATACAHSIVIQYYTIDSSNWKSKAFRGVQLMEAPTIHVRIFTARSYASAVLAMGLCPCLSVSVCHKPVFY